MNKLFHNRIPDCAGGVAGLTSARIRTRPWEHVNFKQGHHIKRRHSCKVEQAGQMLMYFSCARHCTTLSNVPPSISLLNAACELL